MTDTSDAPPDTTTDTAPGPDDSDQLRRMFPPEDYQYDKTTGELIVNKDGSPRRRPGRGAPKKTTGGKGKAGSARTSPNAKTAGAVKIGQGITDTAMGISGLLAQFAGLDDNGVPSNPVLLADAQILAAGADPLGQAVEAVARENPAVRRALEQAFVATSWGQLAVVVASVALPIMRNHGLIGTVPTLVPTPAEEMVNGAAPAA